MKGLRIGLVIASVAVGAVVTTRLTIKAQEDRRNPREASKPLPRTESVKAPSASVQDALERPFSFTFREPTRLDEVRRRLEQALNAPVVLDLAALDRQDLRAEDTVELALEGVRLKTGLKLLLDQVGMTYKVVPEDNLLILTDPRGSDDPLAQVVTELKSLHRDVHDIQDADRRDPRQARRRGGGDHAQADHHRGGARPGPPEGGRPRPAAPGPGAAEVGMSGGIQSAGRGAIPKDADGPGGPLAGRAEERGLPGAGLGAADRGRPEAAPGLARPRGGRAPERSRA